MNEKLSADDGIKAYIDDFKKSDAPQFQGKSASKRKEMAIAAYLDAKKGPKKESAPCWNGYKAVGMKKKGDKMVPNCVPEGTASRWKAQDAAANIYSKEKRKPENDTIKAIRAKYADKKKTTQEGAVKAMNKAKKNRIDREAGHQFRKDNPDLVGKAGPKHKAYGAQATAVGRALRDEDTAWPDKTFLDELTAREKEMIAKRKAARTKKKMAPSQKAQKDAKRDSVGAFNSTKSRAVKKAPGGAGSGKSKGTEHIIMQLRKAQDVGGNMDIQVSPKGKKVRLAKKDIDALLRRHDSMQKPRDKRLFRVMLTRKLRQK